MIYRHRTPKLPTLDIDPLSEALRPPPDESEFDRGVREAEEAEAIRISNEIDARLAQEKSEFEWRRNALKILILGQAHSGKSTVLKNFRLLHSPQEVRSESRAWKAVVQLNLIQSIIRVWDTLDSILTPEPSIYTSASYATTESSLNVMLKHSYSFSSTTTIPSYRRSPLSKYPAELQRLKLKLSPLTRCVEPLEQQLGLSTTTPIPSPSSTVPPTTPSPTEAYAKPHWAEEFTLFPQRLRSRINKYRVMAGNEDGHTNGDEEGEDATTVVLNGCCDDILALWNSPDLERLLGKERMELVHSPGFFLPDAERICNWGYVPSNEDILRARLRTLGVREYIFKAKRRPSSALGTDDWIVYDVGGARSQRDRWSRYFEHVNAIIFLAPISAFNEYLTEDPKVNRLMDSFEIWQHLCTNRLLERAGLVLFLNKKDLLKARLANGARIRDSIAKYKGENDAADFTRHVKSWFKAAMLRSGIKRPFICFETEAINAKYTEKIISNVRDALLREHIVGTGLA